jgi:hypothetical protein
MDEIKAAAKADLASEWSPAEWNTVMSQVGAAVRGAGEGEGRLTRPVLWPRWAAASALGAFLCLIVLGVLFKGPALRTQGPRGSQTTNASAASRQDKVSITMVSPETGLQVVWFLDRNFDWKGERE